MTAETAARIMMSGGSSPTPPTPPVERYDGFFHYVLDHTDAMIEIPIDGTYKYTANLVNIEPGDYELREPRLNWGRERDGSNYFGVAGGGSHTVLAMIAWESGNPLFMSYYEDIFSFQDSYPHVRVNEGTIEDPDTGEEITVYREYCYRGSWSRYIPGSMRFNSGSGVFQFDNNNNFSHQIILPGGSADFNHWSAYAIDRTPLAPEIVANKDPDERPTHMVTSVMMGRTQPRATAGICHSELPAEQIVQKYHDIVKAIYTAHGIPVRDALLPPDRYV